MVQIINTKLRANIIEVINNTGVYYSNLYLVGSRVWGYFSKNSDYDILVETEIDSTCQITPLRVDNSECKFDIKFVNKKKIIGKFLGIYELPKFNLVTEKITMVNENSIIDWILFRKKDSIYEHRYKDKKSWYYDTFGISNKV